MYVYVSVNRFHSCFYCVACKYFKSSLLFRIVQGEQFTFEQHWGEQLCSITAPVAVVCDLQSGQEEVLQTEPFNNISVGQVLKLCCANVGFMSHLNNTQFFYLLCCSYSLNGLMTAVRLCLWAGRITLGSWEFFTAPIAG